MIKSMSLFLACAILAMLLTRCDHPITESGRHASSPESLSLAPL